MSVGFNIIKKTTISLMAKQLGIKKENVRTVSLCFFEDTFFMLLTKIDNTIEKILLTDDQKSFVIERFHKVLLTKIENKEKNLKHNIENIVVEFIDVSIDLSTYIILSSVSYSNGNFKNSINEEF